MAEAAVAEGQLSRAHAERAQAAIDRLIGSIERVIVGKRSTIELAVVVLLSRGHLLLEDVPGVGKTMLARALAKSVDIDTKRIQCTPDLLPSDVTGVSVFHPKTSEFTFAPGPVFTNILLADEINRATPRAQSSLLECMAEFQVSVDGVTRKLPEVFMVIATQNPVESHGAFPLPEAQLDRFLVKTAVGYPGLEDELAMVNAQVREHPVDSVRPVMTVDELGALRRFAEMVYIAPDVQRYIAEVVRGTRGHEALMLGSSPRGTLAISRLARSLALARGQEFVDPRLVAELAVPALAHRVILRPSFAVNAPTAEEVVGAVVAGIKPPVLRG